MSWRKLATGSGSIGIITAGSEVNGALENMIARSALLRRDAGDDHRDALGPSATPAATCRAASEAIIVFSMKLPSVFTRL